MAESKKFKTWHKLECARRLGLLKDIDSIIEEQLDSSKLKIEYL